MKIKKKLMTVILSAVMVFTLATSAFSPFVAKTSAAYVSGDWEYDVSDGTATITKYNGAGGDVVIPSELDGHPVTTIGYYYKYDGGVDAEIPYGSFQNRTDVTSVTIPGSVVSICEVAFCDCSGLTSITIPDSVVSIGYWAFHNCSGLTSLTLGNGVASIDSDAFDGCTGLESITVSSKNTIYHSAGNCLIETAPKALIKGCNTSVIPTDGSVVSIGDFAFWGCSGLTSITIPDSVVSIGDCAFSNCNGLESITVSSGNTVYHSAGNCLIDSSSEILVAGCKNSVIPADGSVTSIARYAFYFCSALTNITIPDSVVSIETQAFQGCSSLTSLTLGNGVASIGVYAFNYCDALTSVTIPDSVTTIESNAFSSCYNLICVTLGSGVTSIESRAFAFCYNLKTVYNLSGLNIVKGETTNGEVAYYADEVVNGHPHTYGAWKKMVAPTMTSGGTIKRVCADYASHVETCDVPALTSTDYTFDAVSGNYLYVKDGQTLYFEAAKDESTVIGAQYRTEGAAGIRFCTEIFMTDKNGLATVDGENVTTFENIEGYGTLIMPLDLLDDPTDLVLTANGMISSAARPSGVEYLNVAATKYYHKFDDKIQFTAVLVGIPDAEPGERNYTREFVAVSYITYKTGETVYSEPVVRSIEQLVAAAN